jgi:hypothetical protein
LGIIYFHIYYWHLDFVSQNKLILELEHEKVVACDATFGTNDKKALSQISLQCSSLWDQYGLPN